MNNPIFIVGANRSGTTLLRLMLNAHPRIAIPDELVYFYAPLAGASTEDWASPDLSREAYRQKVRRFLERNREELAPLSIDELEHKICNAGPPNLRRPYEYALASWADAQGKERWGEKTPGNLFYVDVILDMFPDAQFIYLMRDPRAGVHSMLKSSLFRGGAVINALNRRKYIVRGLSHLQNSVPSAQQVLLQFEDLVRDPEPTLRRLCRFLREDFHPVMLSFHEDSEQYMKQRALDQFNRAATKPVDPDKATAWQQGLSSAQIAEVEWVCRREMDEFGYEREKFALSWASRCAAWLKVAYWHLQDWRHRQSPQFIFQDRILERSRRRVQEMLQFVFDTRGASR